MNCVCCKKYGDCPVEKEPDGRDYLLESNGLNGIECAEYERDFIKPEQYKARTGKLWPDNWAVYVRGFDKKEGGCEFGHAERFFRGWETTTYENAKWVVGRDYFLNVIIICATEAGMPPDGWKPEEKT